jgi:hydroxymethylbilane synthase
MKLRIATRRSPLALWQAEFVAQQLQSHHPDLQIELLPMTSLGDQLLDSPLSKIGGKGLFVKELEKSLLEHESDLAVHSMKDVPADLPEGLCLAAILARDNPADALVSDAFESLEQLPINARVGTSSLRRQMQLLALRPDLEILPLRGNVNSRLRKLAAGDYQAIVLAAAGLERLGLADRIKKVLSFQEMLPAVAQGALGIECRAEDAAVQTLVQSLADAETTLCVTAERAVTARLGASCQVPLAALAQWRTTGLHLLARLGQPNGQHILQAALLLPEAKITDLAAAQILGQAVADLLLAQGGAAILRELGL